MTFEKYTQEVETLTLFVSHYCNDKHRERPKQCRSIPVAYAGEHAEPLETELCDGCMEMVEYGITRLQNCPFDEKPKCRKCSDPCYERPMWKRVAVIMRYSGMKLGLTKIRKRIRFWGE